MAVFVMAVGILSMVVLYPLGLRESTQGQADLKQAIVADYLLNQAVAAASLTNFPWTVWTALPRLAENKSPTDLTAIDFLNKRIKVPSTLGGGQYKISCCIAPGFSDKIMGIVVQSTDLKDANNYNQYSNNPVFYAEAMFQGDPTR